MNGELTCPMCGTRFQAHAGGVCASCPLNGGCQMLACCPRCGYEVVDVRAARLARWAGKLLRVPQPQMKGTTDEKDERDEGTTDEKDERDEGTTDGRDMRDEKDDSRARAVFLPVFLRRSEKRR